MLLQYHQTVQEERVVVVADVCNFVLITTSNTIKIYHQRGVFLFLYKCDGWAYEKGVLRTHILERRPLKKESLTTFFLRRSRLNKKLFLRSFVSGKIFSLRKAGGLISCLISRDEGDLC